MKKLPSLLLCLLLLLCACEKEPQIPEDMGEFYEEHGLLQNDLITVTISDPFPQSLVFELTFELHNNSAYPLHIRKEILEIRASEGWKSAPVTGRGTVYLNGLSFNGYCAPYSTATFYHRFDAREGTPPIYCALNAGEYRMRYEYYQYNIPEGFSTTEAQAVVYFTVT